MLRTATLLILTLVAAGAAHGADRVVAPRAKRHAVTMLPAGLPHPHYRYRTSVVYGAAPAAPIIVESDLLITPAYGPGGYLENLPITPILPGSLTLPGYYGRAASYTYQGPYCGGPYVDYWWRLPYACGVFGYC